MTMLKQYIVNMEYVHQCTMISLTIAWKATIFQYIAPREP